MNDGMTVRHLSFKQAFYVSCHTQKRHELSPYLNIFCLPLAMSFQCEKDNLNSNCFKGKTFYQGYLHELHYSGY
jgi:hypothetical protein